jgi:hypothetical protein
MANEDLQAGRELDVLIATEVMGWVFCNCDVYGGVGEHRHDVDDWSALEPTPRFSTTYEGMGLVLERMRELGWGWKLESWLYFHGAGWGAEVEDFTEKEKSRGRFQVYSLSLPHAVCLAALKAVRSG